MTKVREVYQAIVDLAQSRPNGSEGQCDATQAEIAQKAGVSRRGVLRILGRLVEKGAIRASETHHHYGASPRYSYRITGKLSDKKESHSRKLSDKKESHSRKLSDKKESHSGQKLSDKNGLMNHDMIHDHDMKEIMELLDFIGVPNRDICAARCDLARARVAHDFYEDCLSRDAWQEYGIDPKKGIGYIVRLIKNGSPIPPPRRQIPLPGGAIDLSQALPTLPPPGELDLLWAQADVALHHQMTQATYNQTLAGSRLYRENGYYVVATRSDYGREWLENRLLVQVQRVLSSVIGSEIEVKFKVAEGSLKDREMKL